jgi:hypothetical protein
MRGPESAFLSEYDGETLVSYGLVVEQRTHHRITGRPMKFLALAGWTGIVETELFAQTYKKFPINWSKGAHWSRADGVMPQMMCRLASEQGSPRRGWRQPTFAFWNCRDRALGDCRGIGKVDGILLALFWH